MALERVQTHLQVFFLLPYILWQDSNPAHLRSILMPGSAPPACPSGAEPWGLDYPNKTQNARPLHHRPALMQKSRLFNPKRGKPHIDACGYTVYISCSLLVQDILCQFAYQSTRYPIQKL